ncbi:hypothetical protein FQN57_001885 [Myotisia sp. PD_48]|nr:hypothetical protein FQN57_001885 [Myotisia sp. PD_48]
MVVRKGSDRRDSTSGRSAISLQEQEALIQSTLAHPFLQSDQARQGYADQEPLFDEEPPAYADSVDFSSPRPGVVQPVHSSQGPVVSNDLYAVPSGREVMSKKSSKTVTLEPRLSSDQEELNNLILFQAALPPLLYIRVTGTHTVTRQHDKQGNGKNKDTVTDFDFKIDSSDVVLSATNTRNGQFASTGFDELWRVLSVVRDDDRVSAYRGTRFKSKGNSKSDVSSEDQARLVATQSRETLYTWIERYCQDKSGVKSFTLHRELLNWDTSIIEREIASIIRSTNYRGTICVSPVIHHASLTIYSPHILNRLRTNTFVWWACVILQLWIFTWPLLILLEKRYEPVRSLHYASHGERYIAAFGSEERWAHGYAPAIKMAALTARKDEIVSRVDIALANEMRTNGNGSESERERRERMNSGQGTWADSIVGVVRGVSEVRSEWNRTVGWGGNC